MLRTVNLLFQMFYYFLQLYLLLLEFAVFHAKLFVFNCNSGKLLSKFAHIRSTLHKVLLLLIQTFERHFLTYPIFGLPFSNYPDISRNR